ncbi:MAG TPA: hypothetical protein VGD89_08530 [Flavipsychrobacter sp.]
MEEDKGGGKKHRRSAYHEYTSPLPPHRGTSNVLLRRRIKEEVKTQGLLIASTPPPCTPSQRGTLNVLLWRRIKEEVKNTSKPRFPKRQMEKVENGKNGK